MKKYIFVLILTAFLFVPKTAVHAEIVQCQVEKYTPEQSALAPGVGNQVSALVDNNGPDIARRIRVIVPAPNYAIDTGSVSGFGSNNTGGDITFVDGVIQAGQGTIVNLTVGTSAPEEDTNPESFIYQLSDLTSGTVWTTCITSGGMEFYISANALPQIPTSYEPDEDTIEAVTDLLSSMIAVVFTVIPIAIGVVGTLVVTLFAIRHLRGFFWKFQKWTRGKKAKR